MTPLSAAEIELRMLIQRLEMQAKTSTLSEEDFRSEAIGELVDAIDRFDPSWGTRLLVVLYPRADAQWAAAQLARGER